MRDTSIINASLHALRSSGVHAEFCQCLPASTSSAGQNLQERLPLDSSVRKGLPLNVLKIIHHVHVLGFFFHVIVSSGDLLGWVNRCTVIKFPTIKRKNNRKEKHENYSYSCFHSPTIAGSQITSYIFPIKMSWPLWFIHVETTVIFMYTELLHKIA